MRVMFPKQKKMEPLQEGFVESLAFGGDGIVRLGKFVVFIPFAVPGDKIKFRLIETKKNFGRGEIIEILAPSPKRISPPCPIHKACGGCPLQQMETHAALLEKSCLVESLFVKHLKLEKIPMEPPLASPRSFAYRNKLQVAVQKNPEGKILLGLYHPKTHDVVDMPFCVIEEEANNVLLKAFREGLLDAQLEPYDEKSHTGLVRHCVARANRKGEGYAMLVATSENLPTWRILLERLRSALPSLKGFALNINPQKTNVVLGEKTKILWGEGFLEEQIGDFLYRIPPFSFFQVNTWIVESLFFKIVEWSNLQSNDSVLDLYCGIGTFSFLFAKRAKEVVGIEENKEAVHFAKENAKLNRIANAIFWAGKVEDLISNFQSESFRWVFLDPPRKGVHPNVLKNLIRLKPQKILYLSCNPPTQARDLKILLQEGWKLKKIMVADFFPQTAQIETLALLEK
jgi:23S rRNA (uracil1939-C5)-methyltransferase